MEINGTNPLIVTERSVQRLETPQPERIERKAGEHTESDRIELSVRSREMTHLEELAQSAPDVRDARVEQVRQAIERGTYNVKAELIAGKIIGGSLLDEVF